MWHFHPFEQHSAPPKQLSVLVGCLKRAVTLTLPRKKIFPTFPRSVLQIVRRTDIFTFCLIWYEVLHRMVRWHFEGADRQLHKCSLWSFVFFCCISGISSMNKNVREIKVKKYVVRILSPILIVVSPIIPRWHEEKAQTHKRWITSKGINSTAHSQKMNQKQKKKKITKSHRWQRSTC